MEKSIKDGLICVFDILGYKNFLKNNSVFDCAEKIKEIIANIPNNVKNELFGIIERKNEFKILIPNIDAFINNNLHFVIVSDTIILVFDINDVEKYDFYLFIALTYIRLFQENSFEKGFPLRGCIDIGSFYYYNNIFAGDTIVNSFQEAENLNFSGLIITDKALKIIKERDCNNIFVNEYIYKYLAPLKNNIEEYKNIIEWAIDLKHMKELDIKQYIFESFHAHKKEVNLSTMEKLNNTEKIIRFFYMHRQGRYFA
jgi:hypothetical protein